VLTKNAAVTAAIGGIPDDAWTPVRYPGAVLDPDTGELISDAEVAKTTFTAFGSTKHPVTARPVVRRVRDRAKTEELFPSGATTRSSPTAPSRPWPPTSPTAGAIIETVFADLIDGPLAHLPSSLFAANNAWAICAAITHNLLRAAGTMSSPGQAVVNNHPRGSKRRPIHGSRLRQPMWGGLGRPGGTFDRVERVVRPFSGRA
jgi:hypothetical protein